MKTSLHLHASPLIQSLFDSRVGALVGSIAGLALGLMLPVSAVRAEESGAESSDASAKQSQAWLSSVVWVDDNTLIATQSDGLLLRPGKLVRIRLKSPSEQASTEAQQDWQVIGESETSLWSAIASNDGAVVSDYKGRIIKISPGQASPFQLEARWIRKMVSVPNHPDQIVAGTEDGKLIVLSTESNTEVKRIELGNAAVFDIAFRPDATQVAIGCGDGSIHLRTWPELEPVHSILGQGHAVWSVLYVDNGQQLLSGGADRKVRLWNTSDGKPVVAVTSAADWVTSLIPLPNSSLIAAGCLNGDIVLMDYKSMLGVQTVKAASSGIWSLALSPNGKQLALGTRRNALVLVSDLTAWYEAGKTAAALVATELPPEPPIAP